MREFCLLTKSGHIINMAMVYSGLPPVVNEFQQSRGYHWVPVEKVSREALIAYRYYTERPGDDL